MNAIATYHDNCPVLFGGDLFDSWNHPPEAVSQMLSCMTNPWYCVPGNHDLPYHSYDKIEKSAYWTMVLAGGIQNLAPGKFTHVNGWEVMACPWGFAVPEVAEGTFAAKTAAPRFKTLLLCHKYVWCEDHKHVGATPEAHVGRQGNIDYYDAAFFGDNHKGFVTETREGTKVVNCGAMIRRRSDERDYRPKVYVVYADGTVEPITLDTSKDRFDPSYEVPAEVPAADFAGAKTEKELEFLESVRRLGETGVNFADALRRHLSLSGLPPAAVAKALSWLAPPKGEK